MDCSIRQSFHNPANEIFNLANSLEPQYEQLTLDGAKEIAAFAFDHFAKGAESLIETVGDRKLHITDGVCYIQLNSKKSRSWSATGFVDSNIGLMLTKDGTVSQIMRKVHHPKSKPKMTTFPDLINKSKLSISSTYSPASPIDDPVDKILGLAGLAVEKKLTRETATEIVKYAFEHFEKEMESSEKILYDHEVTITAEGCFINIHSKKIKTISYNENDDEEVSMQNSGLLLRKDGTISIYMRKEVQNPGAKPSISNLFVPVAPKKESKVSTSTSPPLALAE